MPNALLQEFLRPSYFISYSRRDIGAVERLKELLESEVTSMWHDVDQIVAGDAWLREIEVGIQNCDELILLLSDASVSSAVVRQELHMAQSLRKTIRPIAFAPLEVPLPAELQQIHYQVLPDDDHAPKKFLALLTPIKESYAQLAQHDLATATKQSACRTIWPPFEQSMFSPHGQTRLALISSTIEASLPNYAPKSLMTLNAGLIKCLLGDWTRGLQHLRVHAEAAGSLPGWYMYALHLNEGRSLRSMHPGVGAEALRALANAERFGENPLCSVVRGLYEFGFNNLHASHLPHYVRNIEQCNANCRDIGTEYWRLLWNFRDAFDVFRQFREVVTELIKRGGGGRA